MPEASFLGVELVNSLQVDRQGIDLSFIDRFDFVGILVKRGKSIYKIPNLNFSCEGYILFSRRQTE